MPSVSRGLYKWLFRRAAVLEDFADRLNHFWTAGLLLLLACVISWKHGYSQPIRCFTPQSFVSTQHDYAASVCWESHSIEYYRDVEKAAERPSVSIPGYVRLLTDTPTVYQHPPDEDSNLLKTASNTVTLYQWLPLILCFQAMLFKLPNIVMHVLHGFTGISFDKIAGLTAGYDNLNLEERRTLGKQVARYVYRWCSALSNCLPCRLLTCLWLVVKVLFVVNIIAQMAVLDGYLTTKDPPVDNSTSFWDSISGNIYSNNATLWKTSPHFPRNIFCEIEIVMFATIDRYSFQCHLPANEFNEQVYMFLWVWFVFVAVVTCVSALIWVILTLVPVLRKRYIAKALEIATDFDQSSHQPSDVSKFCDVIGEDGVMVLKLLSSNSSELFVKDVVCSMWSQWKGPSSISKAEEAGIE